jgi:hypothetical protein
MLLNLLNLDKQTRELMLAEIHHSILSNTLYISPRLSETGRRDYSVLLEEAAEKHDEDWLADRLSENGRLNASEQRRKPTGGYTIAKVPSNANQTLGAGEFNRFYARGLCQRAISNAIPSLIVYRAKEVSRPRPDSERLVGTSISPKALLDDLRSTDQEADTLLGIGNPNSGLSVRLP